MNREYDFVFLTNTPSFYKLNLCNALARLVQYEALGQRARFERYVADMLYTIASGAKLDTQQTQRFSSIAESIFENPFARRKRRRQPKTAEEVKQYVFCLMVGKEWEPD